MKIKDWKKLSYHLEQKLENKTRCNYAKEENELKGINSIDEKKENNNEINKINENKKNDDFEIEEIIENKKSRIKKTNQKVIKEKERK